MLSRILTSSRSSEFNFGAVQQIEFRVFRNEVLGWNRRAIDSIRQGGAITPDSLPDDRQNHTETKRGSRFTGCLDTHWATCQSTGNSRLPGRSEFAPNLEGYTVGLGTIHNDNDRSAGRVRNGSCNGGRGPA